MATVTWSGQSGDWSSAGEWIGGAVPAEGDDVVIGPGGSGTLTLSGHAYPQSITLDDPAATLVLEPYSQPVLTGPLVLTAGHVTFDYASEFTGTIEADGGGYNFTTSLDSVPLGVAEFYDVAWIGPLDLTGADLDASGLTVQSATAGAPGSILLDNSSLDTYGVGFGDVVLNATGGANLLEAYGTLALGPQALLEASGATTTVDLDATQTSYPTANGQVSNAGSIAISGGATIIVGSGTADFTNTGIISLTGDASALVLAGTMDAAALGSVTADGGWLVIDGSFDNSGNTISFGGASGFSGLQLGDYGGSILHGGTVDDLGGSFVAQNGLLDRVVWNGTLALTGPGWLEIENGLTVVPAGGGPSIIDLSNQSGLTFIDTETISNAVITTNGIAAIDTFAALTLDPDTTIDAEFPPGSTLATNFVTGALTMSGPTLVNGGTIQANTGTDGVVLMQADTLDNPGVITVSGNGNVLAITSTTFLNTGAIVAGGGAALELDNGIPTGGADAGILAVAGANSTLIVGGTVTPAGIAAIDVGKGFVQILGTLDNTGDTLATGPGAALAGLQIGGVPHSQFDGNNAWTPLAATVEGGTIVNTGAVTLTDGTLDNVAWQGPLALTGINTDVTIAGSFSLVAASGGGPGVIDLTGAGSFLSFGSQTLSDTVVHVGAAGGEVLFAGPTSGAAGVTLDTATTLLADTAGAGIISLRGDIVNEGLISDLDGNIEFGADSPDYDDIVISVPTEGPAPPVIYSSGGYAPADLDNAGTFAIDGSAGNVVWINATATLDNAGLIHVAGGNLLRIFTADFANTGTIAIDPGGTVEIASTAADLGSVDFTAPGGTLMFDEPAGAVATISGWAPGDRVLLGYDGGYSLAASGTTLDVMQAGSVAAALDVGSGYDFSDFQLNTSEPAPVIDLVVPCFAAGTRILTARGEVPVEQVRAGDVVALARGGSAPVVWLGHHHVDCRNHPRRHDVLPVRVRRGAFGGGVPRRDLLLSPDHAVWCDGDGVLIPIRYLVNGCTIVRERVAEVTYFHLELDRHEVILAEGLACESYLDTGNRCAFAIQERRGAAPNPSRGQAPGP